MFGFVHFALMTYFERKNNLAHLLPLVGTVLNFSKFALYYRSRPIDFRLC